MPKCQLLKMLALKKYSKFKSKGACTNYSKSYITCAFINVGAYKNTVKMHAHMKMSASKLLLLGLGGLSTLLSFSARLKFSFLFSFSPSEGVAPPPSGPQVGSPLRSAQLIWAACPPYWHAWWYRHAMTKTCQNVGTLWNVGGCRHFDPFSEKKSKS